MITRILEQNVEKRMKMRYLRGKHLEVIKYQMFIE